MFAIGMSCKITESVPPLRNIQRISINGQEFRVEASDVVTVKSKTE
jgi:hypothetical protein